MTTSASEQPRNSDQGENPGRNSSASFSRAANRLSVCSAWTTALAFPAMTLSISGTQILIACAFVCQALALLLAPGTLADFLRTGWRKLPAVWLIGAALFGWLLFSGLLHALGDGLSAAGFSAAADPGANAANAAPNLAKAFPAFGDAVRRGAKGEWGDMALLLFGLLVFVHARRPEYRRILTGGLIAAFALLVLSGLAALFSEFRLARLIPNVIARNLPGAEQAELTASAANRPQHPYAQAGAWTLYRPIGFMNTRLTFAGLLMLMLPWAAGRALLPSRFRAPRRLLWAAGFAMGALLLFINGTRSILLGAAVTAAVGAYLWFRQSHFALTEHRRTRRIAITALIALLAGTAGGVYFALDDVRLQSNRLLARVQRHTDFARPILWTVAGDLAVSNPLLGVGPGNFERDGLEWRAAFVQEHPETLYFFRNTPRGHAHNDLLHLAATGGLPAALLFLGLAGFSIRRLFPAPPDRKKQREAVSPGGPAARSAENDWLLLGTVGFFVAGIAQCYFQDDEVATLYWALLGLGTGLSDQRSEN